MLNPTFPLHGFDDDRCHAGGVYIAAKEFIQCIDGLVNAVAASQLETGRDRHPPGNGPKPSLYGFTLPVRASVNMVLP